MNQFFPPIFLFNQIIKLRDQEAQKIFFNNALIVIKSIENISIKNLKKLSNKFGNLFSNSVSSTKRFFYNTDKEVLEVSEKKMFGKSAMNWHKDMSYIDNEYYGTLLYNLNNDNTTSTQFVFTEKSSFVNDYNSFEYGAYSGNTLLSDNEPNTLKVFKSHYKLRKRFANFNPDSLSMKPVKRQFIITHPITKQKFIYFSPGTVLSKNEIINKIQKDIIQLNKQYNHRWSKNDILIFDNLQLMHKRDQVNQERQLLRLQFNYENIKYK